MMCHGPSEKLFQLTWALSPPCGFDPGQLLLRRFLQPSTPTRKSTGGSRKSWFRPGEVWVVDRQGEVVGLMVLDDDWMNQLPMSIRIRQGRASAGRCSQVR